jgi:serine/threonine protein phosphatase 1
VTLAPGPDDDWRLAATQPAMAAAVPSHHADFLESLQPAFGFGDYFFCHAGIRPEVPLERQSETDLIWIREPFLSWAGDPGKIVVHGHTVHDRPAIRCNRIGIDTGAFWTDRLTCVVLEGSSYRFLSTDPARRA